MHEGVDSFFTEQEAPAAHVGSADRTSALLAQKLAQTLEGQPVDGPVQGYHHPQVFEDMAAITEGEGDRIGYASVILDPTSQRVLQKKIPPIYGMDPEYEWYHHVTLLFAPDMALQKRFAEIFEDGDDVVVKVTGNVWSDDLGIQAAAVDLYVNKFKTVKVHPSKLGGKFFHVSLSGKPGVSAKMSNALPKASDREEEPAAGLALRGRVHISYGTSFRPKKLARMKQPVQKPIDP